MVKERLKLIKKKDEYINKAIINIIKNKKSVTT